VTYYNGRYAIGPDVNYNQLYGLITGYQADPTAGPSSYAHNTENVYATYAQETLDIGKFEILGGARVEVTNATYRANLSTDGFNTFTHNTNKQDYINVFPSLQLKYAFNDQFQLRAAYSTGIARPGFQQISAAESVDLTQSPIMVTKGNPNLKPTMENAFDLTAEYYTSHDGLLSINPFYKFFNNYTVSTLANGSYEGQPAQITSYKNIGGAFVRGVELDAEQKFYFLPMPLDGLGADGNVTFVDSRGSYDTDVNNNPLKANELPETSPITYNASLFYEKGPIDFRVSAAYVSRNLFAVVAGGRSLDQFSSPRFRLDMTASYQVTPQWQIFAEGKNLTNTKLEFTQSASSAYPIQREFYETDYLVGIRYSLGS
jgi:TonB-dependent receptor